jgi:hypothetical protein
VPDTPAHSTTLDHWIAAHGPLSVSAAAVVGLHLCSRASTMADTDLRAAAPQLGSSAIRRARDGEWEWKPAILAGAARVVPSAPQRFRARLPDDAEIVERIGAVLFEAVTGQPLSGRFADDEAVRLQLRQLRADLPPAFSDLVVGAASARRGRRLSLEQMAEELRRVLGVHARPDARPDRRRLLLAGAALAVLAALAAASLRSGEGNRADGWGLTPHETVVSDISLEQVHHLALTDEHTRSLQQLQDLERLWRRRLAAQDPRLTMNLMAQAWVQFLRGDLLTAEQLVVAAPASLARGLGDAHPYTRLAHLQLATVLEARRASEEAAEHRAAAERALSVLLGPREVRAPAVPTATETRGIGESRGMPSPIDVRAHVSPNAPELEGFRRAGEGGYGVLLTSTQRWLADRDGARLVLRATGECRASIDVGRDPRRLAVSAERGADRRWRVSVEGTSPAVILDVASPVAAARGGEGLQSAEEVVVVLTYGRAGNVRVAVHGGLSRGMTTVEADGPRTQDASIDRARPAPEPPYGLSFGPDAGACSLVWWEIGAGTAPSTAAGGAR